MDDGAAADEAVLARRALGAGAVLLKGGHLHEGDTVTDRYADNATTARWQQTRMDVNGHGTGCTLASAIAANLCPGRTPMDACAAAIDYVHDALRRGYKSEEHTSELQSLMRISYAVFCLKNKTKRYQPSTQHKTI